MAKDPFCFLPMLVFKCNQWESNCSSKWKKKSAQIRLLNPWCFNFLTYTLSKLLSVISYIMVPVRIRWNLRVWSTLLAETYFCIEILILKFNIIYATVSNKLPIWAKDLGTSHYTTNLFLPPAVWSCLPVLWAVWVVTSTKL